MIYTVLYQFITPKILALINNNNNLSQSKHFGIVLAIVQAKDKFIRRS